MQNSPSSALLANHLHAFLSVICSDLEKDMVMLLGNASRFSSKILFNTMHHEIETRFLSRHGHWTIGTKYGLNTINLNTLPHPPSKSANSSSCFTCGVKSVSGNRDCFVALPSTGSEYPLNADGADTFAAFIICLSQFFFNMEPAVAFLASTATTGPSTSRRGMHMKRRRREVVD